MGATEQGHLLYNRLCILSYFGTGPSQAIRLITVYISRAGVFVEMCIGLGD